MEENLVSKEDLESLSDYSEQSVDNMWKDESVIQQLKAEMSVALKETYKLYPQGIIIKAVANVIAKASWIDVDRMNANIDKIRNRKYIPFSNITFQKDKKSKNWVQHVIIETRDKYTEDGITFFSKHEVLLSKHFCEAFKDYIKTNLENKAKFWVFSSRGEKNQQLNLSYISKRESDRDRLMRYNIEDLVVVKFYGNL